MMHETRPHPEGDLQATHITGAVESLSQKYGDYDLRPHALTKD